MYWCSISSRAIEFLSNLVLGDYSSTFPDDPVNSIPSSNCTPVMIFARQPGVRWRRRLSCAHSRRVSGSLLIFSSPDAGVGRQFSRICCFQAPPVLRLKSAQYHQIFRGFLYTQREPSRSQSTDQTRPAINVTTMNGVVVPSSGRATSDISAIMYLSICDVLCTGGPGHAGFG